MGRGALYFLCDAFSSIKISFDLLSYPSGHRYRHRIPNLPVYIPSCAGEFETVREALQPRIFPRSIWPDPMTVFHKTCTNILRIVGDTAWGPVILVRVRYNRLVSIRTIKPFIHILRDVYFRIALKYIFQAQRPFVRLFKA